MSGYFDDQYEDAEPSAPQPIALRSALAEAADFPVHALSPTIRGAVEAIVDIVQVPPSMAAQSVLSAAALVCQQRYNVRLPTRQEVPTSLFCFTVAVSGDRKSTGDGHAVKPIRERERELKQREAGDLSDYENNLAAYDAAKTAAKRAGTGERKKTRDQIRAELDALGRPPVKPPVGILVTDEATVPGLQKLLAEAMPSLGLFSDDGASWLQGWSMSDDNSASTGSSLSLLWDGKPVKRVRATEVTLLYGRRLSVHLMVQPGVALKLFGNKALRDQGMMARLLVAYPKSMRGQRFWREPTEDSWAALSTYQVRLAKRLALDMNMDPETRELQLATLELAPNARARWIEYSDHNEKLMAPGGEYEDIGDFASKAAENAARIAAVLSFFERDRRVEPEGISEDAMLAAIHIMRFYTGEALRLFGASSVDDDSDNAQALIDWVRGKGLAQVGTQYLSQSAPKHIRPAEKLKRALSMLQEHGHLREIKGGARISIGGKEKFYREAFAVIAEEA